MKKVIFWDFDGTLAYSDHLWSNSIYDALKIRMSDTTVTFEEIRYMTRGIYTWDTPFEDYSHITGERWWQCLQNRLCEKLQAISVPPEIARSASLSIRQEILKPEKYHLYDDALIILEHCGRLGYQNYLLSNNYPELEDTAHKLGLAEWLDGCFVSALIGYDKPRREIFEYALAQTGHPGIRFMVGDNRTADVIGSGQAGMKTIFVHNGDCPNADYSCSTLLEIKNIL